MTNDDRKPEKLAERLDQTVPPKQDVTLPGDNDPLIKVAQKLATSEYPTLPSDKAQQIQEKMLDAHKRLRKSGKLYRFAAVQRALEVLAVLEGILLLIIFIGIRPQISASVPGDWLYPLKRAGECVEMAVTDITQSDAEIYTELAERRTNEVVLLLGRGRLDVDLVKEALNNLAKAGDATAATESPEYAEQATRIGGLLVTVVERASENQGWATEETLDSLTDILQTMQESGDLVLPQTSTPTTPSPIPASTPTPDETGQNTGHESSPCTELPLM